MRIFLRVTALFWKHWRLAVVAYGCLLAGAALSLLIPQLTGNAVDAALGSNQIHLLVLLSIGVAGAGVVRSVFSYYQSYLAEIVSQKVSFDLRNKIYDHLQRLSFAFHDHSQTGQLMSRATVDVEAIRMFVGFALLRGVYFLVLFLAIVVLMLLLDWKLALISLAVLPFITYRTVAISQKLRGLWSRIQQGVGVMGTIVQENLVGSRVVRAFAREDYENKKFQRQAKSVYEMEIEANNLLASNSPIMTFALMVALAAILWYGGRQVIGHTLTFGDLTKFLLYLVMLTTPIRMLGWLTILFSRAMASGRRIFEVLDQSSPVRDRPDAVSLSGVTGSVTFDNVSFGYGGSSDVLKDISFAANPGSVVALVGPSGSGKSTIANLIPRFYDVTAGKISVDGTDIRSVSLASLRRIVGIIHQDTFLFSGTIRENIAYGFPEATPEQITTAARIARLHDFIMSLPDGYETWVGERGITLSGGQKQRLAIARTLLMDPRILIMDDSTSSVDTQTEILIQQALAELRAGRTTFIIAHRLRSVQSADLILVLKDGEIVERGRHAELIANGGLYRQIYTLQFQGQEDAGNAAPVTVLTEEVPPEADCNHRAAEKEPSLQADRDSLTGSDGLVYGKPYDSRVVSRLGRYFSSYRVALPLTIGSTLLFTFTSVANPYLVGIAENNYIVSGNLGGLNLMIVFFLINALFNLGAYYTQIRAEARLGQGILLNLRAQLFDHVQNLSVHFFDANEVGRVMSRIQNDVGELGEFLDSGAFWVIGEIFSLLTIIVVMFTMDARLALLTMSVVPVLFGFLFFWQRRARRNFIQVRQALSGVNAALEENISGIRVIQSLSREALNAQRFTRVNQDYYRTTIRAARISAGMMPAVELLVAVATAIIILFGGQQVLAGTFLVGTLVAFVLYIQNFFDPIRNLTMEYGQLQRAMASGARIFELLDIEREKPLPVTTSPGKIKGDILFQNVNFSYEPGLPVLHDVNLHVRPGETVALVGPTGAGKTTIVSLIARFYDVIYGHILVDGTAINRIDRTAYRRQIGLVLQDPFLFSGTIRENIRYGRLEATDEDIVSAAAAVGAHDFISHLVRGYETELEERGQNLSMGQRQLISFARALLADPAILLLDEATASIDSYSESVLQNSLARLRRGRTTVIIAHRLSTIREADHIVVLAGGKIVEEGRHDDLLARDGLYARLYRLTGTPGIAGVK